MILGLSLLSLFWSENMTNGVVEILKVSLYVIFYLFAINLDLLRKHIVAALWVWGLASAASLIMSLYLQSSGTGEARLQGLMGSGASLFATNLAISYFVVLALTACHSRVLGQWLGVLFSLLFVLGMALAGTRNAWVGWATGTCIFAVISKEVRWKIAIHFFILSFAVTVILLTVPREQGRGIGAFANRFRLLMSESTQRRSPFLAIWPSSLEYSLESYGVGKGYGTHFTFDPGDYQTWRTKTSNDPGNLFIFFLGKLGLLGLGLFIWFLYEMLKVILGTLRDVSPGLDRTLMAAVVAGLFPLFTNSCFAGVPNESLQWFFLTMAFQICKVYNADRTLEPQSCRKGVGDAVAKSQSFSEKCQ